MIERLPVPILAGAAGEFSSPASTLCADSYSVSVPPPPPRVTAMTRKRPRSFCQKCRWQVTPKHAHTFDLTKSEWADYAAVQAQCGNLSENKLTRNLSGNIRPQLSQLAEPLWTDSGMKEWHWFARLISTSKKKQTKKRQSVNGEWMVEHSSKTLASAEESHHCGRVLRTSEMAIV